MTRYTVVWVQSVEDELVEIWLASNSNERTAITSATHAIDSELSRDAEGKGENVAEGFLALNVPPLRVIFTVSTDDRVVEVVHVARL